MNIFKKIIVALTIASLLLFSSKVTASTIIVDDANLGVGTVMRDTSNNLGFLRLDLTMG